MTLDLTDEGIETSSGTAKSTTSAEKSVAPEPDRSDAASDTRRGRRSVAVPLVTLGWSAAVTVAILVAFVASGFLIAARDDLADRDATAGHRAHAEQVATDYAVGASTVNYTDFGAWVTRLKAETAPALATKFDASAPKLQDLLVPLKWTSTGTPIAAKVMSEQDGTYRVNVFVNVTSTNAQNPEGVQTTVTYNVTVDRNADWKVTDVGGMDGALPLK
ncbi:hypothetical protein JK358_33865 [Nocardia sp. 2]|uniref:Mce-associated membrane protein n=1 Tax=Nocardia acididurans TaxID=2802282 RepID=A0ABS1MIA3_9NOCA|nr:hypothetical protein [Nocardia acididurans]MBL1079404.1 hypothetical protein [Nocardia acididurans]